MICFVENGETRRNVAEGILRALPEWFGIEQSLKNYVQTSADLPFWAAYDGEKAIGFLALRQTGKTASEVFVMGVAPEYHGKGLGRQLMQAAEQNARSRGIRYLQVKTVQVGHYPLYDATNRFYQAMGFEELECIPELWDEANPCQIYVKYIGG